MASSEAHPTYWLTRDESEDGLAPGIDVWMVRPNRHSLPGGGGMWLGPDDTGLEERYATWTIPHTLKECRVYPETSRECIRVGHEP